VRAHPLIAACALAAFLATPARAQEPSHAPSGLELAASIAAGGEMGLSSGKAGLLELELLGGWEHAPTRLAAELAVAFSFGAENSLAVRPGLRYRLEQLPISLRAALDLSNARSDSNGLHARWLLFGAAWEVRFTSLFALSAGLESGIPLAGTAGVPFLVRVGGTFSP
jgi:hypothetical protein